MEDMAEFIVNCGKQHLLLIYGQQRTPNEAEDIRKAFCGMKDGKSPGLAILSAILTIPANIVNGCFEMVTNSVLNGRFNVQEREPTLMH